MSTVLENWCSRTGAPPFEQRSNPNRLTFNARYSKVGKGERCGFVGGVSLVSCTRETTIEKGDKAMSDRYNEGNEFLWLFFCDEWNEQLRTQN